MNLQNSPYTLPLLFVAGMAVVLGIYAWRQRPSMGAAAFAISLAGEALWSFANAFQWASADFQVQVFWAKLRLVGTETIALFFLFFALQYSRQNRRIPRSFFLLGLFSLAWVTLAFTNEQHGLFWTSVEQADLGNFSGLAFHFGPAFWIHTAFDYLLLSGTLVLFGNAFLRSRAIYRSQMGTVLLGMTIPWLTNIIFIFDLSPIPYLDLTPFGLMIGMIALTAGFFRYRILDLVSISRDSMLQHMSDALVVVDSAGRLVDLNPASEHLIGQPASELITLPAEQVFERWPALADAFKRLDGNRHAEVQFENQQGPQFFELRISELLREDGERVGHLVQLHDIRARKQTEAERRKSLTFLGTLEEAYFEADLEGNLTYANQVFSDSVGQSREEIIGRSFREFIRPEQAGRLQEVVNEVLETGKTALRVEYAFPTLDGSIRYGEASISRLLDERDHAVGVRSLIRDVTERVENARRISQARDEAETLARDLASINRISDRVSNSLQLGEILQAICEELVQIFQVRNAGIGLLDPNGGHLVITAIHSRDPNEPEIIGTKIPLKGNRASRLALESHKAVIIRDAQKDPLTESIHDLMRARGTRSLLIVPLLARGEAIGTIGMPANDPLRVFTEVEVTLAETIAQQVASAIDNANLYSLTETARDIAERDLEIGRNIQTSFFPKTLPTSPGWELEAYFRPARQVAGDFYDAFEIGTSGKIAIVLADVTDKGVGAALFMALLRTLIRVLAAREDFETHAGRALQHIVLAINNYVATTHGDSNMFATIFFGVLDPDKNELTYVNAGQDMPVLLSASGEGRVRLSPTGPAVGFFPDMPFEVQQVLLEPGDILLIYTDGTTDVRNREEEFFGEARLEEVIFHKYPSALSLLKKIETRIEEYSSGARQFDDITLLALRRRLGPADHRHSLCLPARKEHILVLRDFVTRACETLGVDRDSQFVLKLAAEEIVSNIVLYGVIGRRDAHIRVTVVREPEKIFLKVWDNGAAFDPSDAPIPDIRAGLDERKEGGLGIHLIYNMVDRLDYESDPEKGNTLTLVKNLRGALAE